MSICVAFNLSDGVVIAVDSATTIVDHTGSITKVFTDADKIFQLGDLRIGIATYGVAALRGRTIGSFVREFWLLPENGDLADLELREVVERLRVFFLDNYRGFLEEIHSKPFDDIGEESKGVLGLVVGGFSHQAFQSEVWEIQIPVHLEPYSAIQQSARGEYGFTWYASSVPISRYLKGFDTGLMSRLLDLFIEIVGRPFTDEESEKFRKVLRSGEYSVVVSGMPIQSGIDCAKFLVNFVLGHYRFAETHPIVGGKPIIGVVSYDQDAFRIQK